MTLPIPQIVFFTFSALLLGSATMVILSRHAVRGVLFLILAFFASAVLWMMLEAEFLALALIFVYVGAVMTLFLFVVMMLNLDAAPRSEGFVKHLPFGLLAIGILLATMILVIGPKHFGLINFTAPPLQPAHYSNVKELGMVLYTDFMYPFEIAAVILLVAIISAISLAFRGAQNRKVQHIGDQLKATKANRLDIVKMKPEKR